MTSSVHTQELCDELTVENDRVYATLHADHDLTQWLSALKELDLELMQGREFWVDVKGALSPEFNAAEFCGLVEEKAHLALHGIRLDRNDAQEMLKEVAGVSVEIIRPFVSQQRTAHVKRTIRSGRSLRYDGHVVLMGDVNPGAHIAATGNIIILGALKGTAHAGANGDEGAHVMALSLTPIQVRIGRRIAVSPPASRLAPEPQVASVQGGQITFEPYRRFISR